MTKCYGELLQKVRIDSYVREIWLLKYKKKFKKKNKRRKHAAATYCAPYKHRVRYKNAVEKSCGRCMDAVRTLCTANTTDHNIVIGIFIYAMTSYHFWHGEMTLYLLHGPRISPVKNHYIKRSVSRSRFMVNCQNRTKWISTIKDRLFEFS